LRSPDPHHSDCMDQGFGSCLICPVSPISIFSPSSHSGRRIGVIAGEVIEKRRLAMSSGSNRIGFPDRISTLAATPRMTVCEPHVCPAGSGMAPESGRELIEKTGVRERFRDVWCHRSDGKGLGQTSRLNAETPSPKNGCLSHLGEQGCWLGDFPRRCNAGARGRLILGGPRSRTWFPVWQLPPSTWPLPPPACDSQSPG